jgi:hypothetical protein
MLAGAVNDRPVLRTVQLFGLEPSALRQLFTENQSASKKRQLLSSKSRHSAALCEMRRMDVS